MATLTTLARPYGRAVFDYALAQGRLDHWEQTLDALCAAVSDARVARLLHSPRYSLEEKLRTLQELCREALDAHGRALLEMLAQHHRLPLLPQVREEFHRLRARHENTIDVQLHSAFQVDDASRARWEKVLQKKLGARIAAAAWVEPALLGGIRIRAGDMVIDGSLRGRLQQLRQALAK